MIYLVQMYKFRRKQVCWSCVMADLRLLYEIILILYIRIVLSFHTVLYLWQLWWKSICITANTIAFRDIWFCSCVFVSFIWLWVFHPVTMSPSSVHSGLVVMPLKLLNNGSCFPSLLTVIHSVCISRQVVFLDCHRSSFLRAV